MRYAVPSGLTERTLARLLVVDRVLVIDRVRVHVCVCCCRKNHRSLKDQTPYGTTAVRCERRRAFPAALLAKNVVVLRMTMEEEE